MPYANRTPVAGFPRADAFSTREQIDQYFADKRITCLQCGRRFQSLEPHLRQVHQMTPDDYREMYAIPYKRGLCGVEFSAIRSLRSTEMFANNEERQRAALASAKAVQAEFGNQQRHKPEFWKKERTKYTPDDFEEFLRRVSLGRSKNSVSKDDGMPTATHVAWYLKRKTQPPPPGEG